MKRSADEILDDDSKQAKMFKSNESEDTSKNSSSLSIVSTEKEELDHPKEENVPCKSLTGNEKLLSNMDGTSENADYSDKTNILKENAHSEKNDDISVEESDISGVQLSKECASADGEIQMSMSAASSEPSQAENRDDSLTCSEGRENLNTRPGSDKTDAVKGRNYRSRKRSHSSDDASIDREELSTEKKKGSSTKKRSWRTSQSQENVSDKNNSSDKKLLEGKTLSCNDDKKHYSKEKITDADSRRSSRKSETKNKHNLSPSKDGGPVSSQEKKKISSSPKYEDSSSRRDKDGKHSSPQKSESSNSRGERNRHRSSPHKDKHSGSRQGKDKRQSSPQKGESSRQNRERQYSSPNKGDRSSSRWERGRQHSSSHKDKSSDSRWDKEGHHSSSCKGEEGSSSRCDQDEQDNSNPEIESPYHPSCSQKVKSPRKESRFNSVESKTKLNIQNSIDLLNQDYSKDRKDHFHFFFGKDSPFSNFHLAKFDLDGFTYCCSEQYMMHQKAVTFKDLYHANEIMKTTDPVKMKKFGRKVQNFNAPQWAQISEKVVKKGIMAKFRQNRHLMTALIGTFPRILVEAAPRDRLWGIGLGAQNPKAHCRKTWRGKNKLGYLLTRVRNEIMKNEGLFS